MAGWVADWPAGRRLGRLGGGLAGGRGWAGRAVASPAGGGWRRQSPGRVMPACANAAKVMVMSNGQDGVCHVC